MYHICPQNRASMYVDLSGGMGYDEDDQGTGGQHVYGADSNSIAKWGMGESYADYESSDQGALFEKRERLERAARLLHAAANKEKDGRG